MRNAPLPTVPDPERVFVVDDDAAVLHSVEALFEDSGFEIRCFPSAERFLSKAELDRPGCLITDLQMPGIPGAELLRRLSQTRSPLVVVVVTGIADLPTTDMLLKNGAATLLEKPYEPAQLVAVVVEALRASRDRWQRRDSRQG